MTVSFKMENGFAPHLIYVLFLPVFFLAAALLYNPFDIEGYYSFGSMSFGFHLVMLSCIILVCELLTRLFLCLILLKNEMEWSHYVVWCIGETLLMSAFASLYTLLFKGAEGGYFAIFPDCFKFITLILVYPYVFLILIRVINLQEDIMERKGSQDDNSLVRFYDEHHRLKLSIAPSAILYVNSDFNYVKIHYLDAGKVREFTLRASMKSLESIGCKSLVRCQRSYFVNPEHISVLRKDRDGFIYAEMNIPDVPAVPVSKQYYEALSALL